MTKTRIAVLQNGLIRGGTERFVINLCKGLDKEKFDITVINPSLRREEQVLEPEAVAAGAKVIHTTTIAGLGGRVKHLYRLYKILRQGRYDVFHTNMDLFNGCNLLVARLANVPVRICHCLVSDTITKQAQCGLIEYKSLSDGAQSWAETIEKKLATEAPRPTADTQALSRFTVPFMTDALCRVINASI